MTSFHGAWSQLWRWNDQIKDQVLYLTGLGGAERVKQTGAGRELPADPSPENKRNYTNTQRAGLITGPVLFALIHFFFTFGNIPDQASTMLGIVAWVATWWVTEALPIPLTSLLPLILFPLLGIMDTGSVSASYGDSLIFLFAGSFMIALSMEKWNLHKRIALSIIGFIGTNPGMIILGFMTATGFLSMWISNTATTMLMIPMALAVMKQLSHSLKQSQNQLDQENAEFNFGHSLMLGTAYAATLGGFGTLIGAPANTILAATVKKLYDVEISFAQWMLFGIPLVVVLIPLVWFYLTKIAYPIRIKQLSGGKEVIKNEQHSLGRMGDEEKVVLTIFTLTALAWITSSFFLSTFIPGIDDTVIALIAAFALFIIPAKTQSGSIMDWETAKKLPWGILWLFGGGLAIAAGITRSGLAQWIGGLLVNFTEVPVWLTLLLIISTITALTEFTSNTATATMVYPIVAAAATALNADPILLMVAGCMGATFAFMFPVAAPPNAIAFATGYIKMSSMAKTGIWLNLLCLLFSLLIMTTLAPAIFSGMIP
ncbi:SLC13 family permease [Rossellomorea marisflavi]|uniref:SLC13 family permease n=1 Tax=Rossellomorea marisflavi TaxID=189381 RepID=UPI00207AD895|nr:DASS family sodium-coupled anion symporter [Rossellomorea marisflavi]USK91379.1 DASS family sodium-coupled anion symporter [Rossellomorea marisflavi]